jgi:hypothetical protein
MKAITGFSLLFFWGLNALGQLYDTTLSNFFVARQNSDYSAIKAYTNQLKAFTDTTLFTDTLHYDSIWQSSWGA